MEVEQLDERLTRFVAPNGLRVLTEDLPGIRSAALGLWVRAGSAHETPAQMGAAHLLEHLVFKGTERRTAAAIAQALESRGGTLDAFTSRDHTVFQAHVLDADLPVAVDVLSDLVRRPLLRPTDLELERNVVLEEINSVADTPDDLVFDLHARALWNGHPYGYAILGTPETVGALTAPDLRAFHAAGYRPDHCVVVAAGHVNPDLLLAGLETEGWLAGGPPAGGASRPPLPPAEARRGRREVVSRDTQQCHIVFGTDTMESRDPRRYALGLVVTALGGGMSSRLFQRVREELGLAYAVFAFQHFYQAAGMGGVYVGTRAETADQATDAIFAEYDRLAREGLPPDELARVQRHLKGQIVLALESPVSRMHRLATLELLGEPYRRIDDVLAEIDAVTPDQTRALAQEFFGPERQTVVRLGGATGGPPAN